jgi:hypothetical protein
MNKMENERMNTLEKWWNEHSRKEMKWIVWKSDIMNIIIKWWNKQDKIYGINTVGKWWNEPCGKWYNEDYQKVM